MNKTIQNSNGLTFKQLKEFVNNAKNIRDDAVVYISCIKLDEIRPIKKIDGEFDRVDLTDYIVL